jgi:hypothetical protein
MPWGCRAIIITPFPEGIRRCLAQAWEQCAANSLRALDGLNHTSLRQANYEAMREVLLANWPRQRTYPIASRPAPIGMVKGGPGCQELVYRVIQPIGELFMMASGKAQAGIRLMDGGAHKCRGGSCSLPAL